jgi:hypothetical protein
MVFTIIMATLYALILFFAYMLRRTTKVYNYRRTLIDRIYDCSERDVKEHKYDGKRWEALEKVTFHDMVWRFWKPLKDETWFKDTRFLE